jgi:hypothetical protein
MIMCGGRTLMPTNLAIDDRLLEEALRLGKHRTKEYVERRRQLEILDLFGQVDYDPAYDYKKQRTRR